MHLALFIWKQYLGEIVYLISSRARSNQQGNSLDHGLVRIARANWRRFIWDSFQGQSESNRSDGGSQENSASKCERRISYQYSQRNRKSQEVVSLSKHCQVGIYTNEALHILSLRKLQGFLLYGFLKENIFVYCLLWLIDLHVILSDKILRSYCLNDKNLTWYQS